MDPPARILLVEDEAITALAVARQLRRLGYQVVALARSGPQAIQHALSLRPQVVSWISICTGRWTALTPHDTFRPLRPFLSST